MTHATFEVTAADFQANVLNATQPVLLEFGADWCPPCKMLAPTMQYLAQKYVGKLTVATIDSDEVPDLVQRYGIMGLPTLLLFRDGQPIQRLIGFQPRERIEAQITAALQLQQA